MKNFTILSQQKTDEFYIFSMPKGWFLLKKFLKVKNKDVKGVYLVLNLINRKKKLFFNNKKSKFKLILNLLLVNLLDISITCTIIILSSSFLYELNFPKRGKKSTGNTWKF